MKPRQFSLSKHFFWQSVTLSALRSVWFAPPVKFTKSRDKNLVLPDMGVFLSQESGDVFLNPGGHKQEVLAVATSYIQIELFPHGENCVRRIRETLPPPKRQASIVVEQKRNSTRRPETRRGGEVDLSGGGYGELTRGIDRLVVVSGPDDGDGRVKTEKTKRLEEPLEGRNPAAKVELGETRICFWAGVHGEFEAEKEEIIFFGFGASMEMEEGGDEDDGDAPTGAAFQDTILR
nr:hypothetical protein Itr_chr05CG01560 [Ipomoea trifida]